LEIFLTILYALLFIFLIYKLSFFKIEGFKRASLVIVFLLKICAGLAMYFIYTYYYTNRATADIFRYFDDSKVMYDALWHHPQDYFKMLFGIGNDSPYFDVYYKTMNNWYRVFESNIYNDSHTIIRINAVIRLFSFGCFNVHTVFMCFISLTGLTALYKFFVLYLKEKKRELFFAVFLIPSVLFWSSGVLKEAILLFGMGMLLYYLEKLTREKFSIRALVWLVYSIILLIYTKYYIIIILIPLLVAFLWCKYTNEKRSLLKYSLVLLVYIAIGLNIHLVFPGYDMLEIIAQKQNDFIGLAKEMHSGSLLTQNMMQPNLMGLVRDAPVAFYNSLVRPYVWESNSLLILFSALENILLFLLIIICLIFIQRRIPHKPVFYLCLFFFVATYTLTGLTSPVMGAMVRYKVPAMPFMLIFFVMMFSKEKFYNKLPFLRKFQTRTSAE
jgi:hypothetical protein